MRFSLRSEDKLIISKLTADLSKNGQTIAVADFGAGSKKLGNQRKISSIYRTSSSKGRFAQFFYQLAGFYRPNRILEFGTSLGIGTIHFAKGNPNAEIITVEACPETAKIAQSNFQLVKATNIQLINQTFNDFIPQLKPGKFDLIFIDGHHDGTALLNYVDALEPWMHDETMVILDDIRWSDSMLNAWNLLRVDTRFNVSIDFFRMGMLVKRPSQEKEHFFIKFRG